MFTTVDKAIVAIIGGLLTVASMVFGMDLNISPEFIGAIGSVVSGVLVYLVPNKEPVSAEPTE